MIFYFVWPPFAEDQQKPCVQLVLPWKTSVGAMCTWKINWNITNCKSKTNKSFEKNINGKTIKSIQKCILKACQFTCNYVKFSNYFLNLGFLGEKYSNLNFNWGSQISKCFKSVQKFKPPGSPVGQVVEVGKIKLFYMLLKSEKN